jgi:hypothetical protein
MTAPAASPAPASVPTGTPVIGSPTSISAVIKAKIALIDAAIHEVESDIKNAPLEIRAEFVKVESDTEAFLKEHLTAAIGLAGAAFLALGIALAHALHI